MKDNLLFDFTVDKTKNTVFVNREFDADQSTVWDAFTKQEILDLWWAPTTLGFKNQNYGFQSRWPQILRNGKSRRTRTLFH